MDPYNKTAEEFKRQSEGPRRFAKTALNVGSTIAGATAFAPILAKAAPFLSQYIPENLAIKGLSKISPKLGQFVQNAMKEGYDFNEVKDFIGEQVKQSQPAQENRNIIEQESPELHKFLDQEIRKGRKPIEAGAIAQNDKRFASIIKNLMKKHKTSWSSIIESIFGSGERALPQSQASIAQEVLNPPGSLPAGPPSAEAQAAQRSSLIDPTKGAGQYPNRGSVQNNQQPQPKNETRAQIAQRLFNESRKQAASQRQEQQSNQGLDPQVAQILQQGNEIIKKFRGQP